MPLSNRWWILWFIHFSSNNCPENKEELDHFWSTFFHHAQLIAYLRTLLDEWKRMRKLTSPAWQNSCKAYSFPSICITSRPQQDLSFIQKWETYLQTIISQSQKDRVIIFVHKTSIVRTNQVRGYKLLTRWYRTPVIVHHMFPQISNKCWRCLGMEGTLLRIFLDCPRLPGHGKTNSQNPYRCVSSNKILQDIYTPLSIKKYINSLLKHLLKKVCILTLWKQTLPPAKTHWCARNPRKWSYPSFKT